MLPNFFIIGAAKSGTTSLYECLKQHPQIYMSKIKEPRFFAMQNSKDHLFFDYYKNKIDWEIVTDLNNYIDLFNDVTTENAVGDASTLYMYSETASSYMSEMIPSPRFIVILRNPIDRAFSHFTYFVNTGREKELVFSKALGMEDYRAKNNYGLLWSYTRMGFYSIQLERYFEKFDMDKFRIFLYEEWLRKPMDVLCDIFNFLQVDRLFKPDIHIKYNVSGYPKSQFVDLILRKKSLLKFFFKIIIPIKTRRKIIFNIKMKNLHKPKMLQSDRDRLAELYRDDITRLQYIIDRDLSYWM